MSALTAISDMLLSANGLLLLLLNYSMVTIRSTCMLVGLYVSVVCIICVGGGCG